ncbi:MAG TPA: nuclear transport factor 2 family protein [Xanthobacteraceae bacterium]|nr:nuclear transport factor 2 family protein [Xanthobacteraceae bacterium]
MVLAQSRARPLSGEEALVNAAQTSLGQALRSGDKSAARKLLSLQFTFADQNGKIFQRKEFLADLKTIAAGEAATDVKVSVYGLVAMVTGTRKSAQGSPVFFLDIWAKQKGSWRALTMQDVVLGSDARVAAETPPGTKAKADAKPYECKNPCETIPYRVRSPAEQDVITTFQNIQKAAVAHNADEWAKHVAEDFVLYRSGYTPVPKSGNIATIEREKKTNASVTVSEIETMRLSVYGDGAAMIASHVSPDNSRPPFRAASIWAKRNGQWQLMIDVETDVKG